MQRTGRARRLVAVVVVRATALLLVVVVVVIRRHFLKSARGLANSCACAVILCVFGFVSIFFKTKKAGSKDGRPEHLRRRVSKSGQASPLVILWDDRHRLSDLSRQLRGLQHRRETNRQIEQKTTREKVHAVRWVAFHIVWDV